jgi:hypothetical protein
MIEIELSKGQVIDSSDIQNIVTSLILVKSRSPMFCMECGKALSGSPKFCSECGTQVVGFKLSDQPPVPFAEINIAELISKHFELLGGYGTSPEDRRLIKDAIFRLFDDVAIAIDGKSHRDGDLVSEKLREVMPVIHEAILKSNLIPEQIIPIISNLLLRQHMNRTKDSKIYYVEGSSITYPCYHELIKNSLRDVLSDGNLYTFGEDAVRDFLIMFYKEHYPEGIGDFLQNLNRAAESSMPGALEGFPEFCDGTFDGFERKSMWQTLYSAFQLAFYPKITTVRQVLESKEWLNKYIQHLEENYLSHMLEEEWLGFFTCRESAGENKSPNDGAEKIIFFTSGGVCEIFQDTTFMSKARSKPDYIKRQNVARITVGTKIHETHAGFGSSANTWITLTIETTGHRINTKYIYLGDSEKLMNENRPIIMAHLDSISKQYSLEAGTTVQSSSGFTITPSIGFWHSI